MTTLNSTPPPSAEHSCCRFSRGRGRQQERWPGARAKGGGRGWAGGEGELDVWLNAAMSPRPLGSMICVAHLEDLTAAHLSRNRQRARCPQPSIKYGRATPVRRYRPDRGCRHAPGPPRPPTVSLNTAIRQSELNDIR